MTNIYVLCNSLGEMVAQLRKDVGLSQADMEKRLQYPKGWMSAKEKRKSEFKVSDLLAVTDGFGVHSLTLFVRLLAYFGRLDTLPEPLRHDLEEFARNDLRRAKEANNHDETV